MSEQATNALPGVVGKIFSAIPAMIAEVAAVKKDRENKQQGYMFRGVDAVYNVANPVFGKHGVFVVTKVLKESREEKPTRSGGLMTHCRMRVRFTFYASDGSSVCSIINQEGSDTADKASGKALSMAFKYAMFQLLCIPTDDLIDGDDEKHEFASGDAGDSNTKGESKGKKKTGGKKTPTQTAAELFEDSERPLTEHEQKYVDDMLPKLTRAPSRAALTEMSKQIKEQAANVRAAVRETYAIRLGKLPEEKDQAWVDDFLKELPQVPLDALDVVTRNAQDKGGKVFDFLKPFIDGRRHELQPNA